MNANSLRRPAVAPLRRRANLGRWFQRLIDAACRHYAVQGAAHIFPVPTPMRVAARRGAATRGNFLAFFERKSITDYYGTLPSGRSIAFDAKSTTTRTWRSDIPPHQLDVLHLVHALGGLSGILIGFDDGRGTLRVFWVPWPEAAALGHGQWTADAVSALPGATAVSCPGHVDFLPALLGGSGGTPTDGRSPLLPTDKNTPVR